MTSNSSASAVIDRYARVKGSGPFDINDFCAITGYPVRSAIAILDQEESVSGRILRLDTGFYLLKPLRSIPATPSWYDWSFKLDIQQRIWDACASWKTKADLFDVSGLKSTALDRYLRAMVRAGVLRYITQSTSHIKLYIQCSWRPLTTYFTEMAYPIPSQSEAIDA